MAQRSDLLQKKLRRSHRIGFELFIDFQNALVLGAVAAIVTQCQHTPDLGAEPEGMRQALEDDVAIVGRYPCQRKAAKASACEAL